MEFTLMHVSILWLWIEVKLIVLLPAVRSWYERLIENLHGSLKFRKIFSPIEFLKGVISWIGTAFFLLCFKEIMKARLKGFFYRSEHESYLKSAICSESQSLWVLF